MGQDPLIDDNMFAVQIPSDVDEDTFEPGSSSLPQPTETSNFSFFVQKCRYVTSLATISCLLANLSLTDWRSSSRASGDGWQASSVQRSLR